MKKLAGAVLLILLTLNVHAETIVVGLYESALTTGMSQKDYTLGMSLLMEEFLKNEKISARILAYDDPIKMADDFQNGKVDMIASDPLTVIEHLPYSALQSGITGYKNNKTDAQTLLLLSRSDDTRPLSEKLHGKVAETGEKVTELYLKTLMLQNGLYQVPDILAVKNSQQAILKLFFKQADLALVDRGSYEVAAELNPQLKKSLNVLKTVPLTISSVCFTRKGISPQMHATIILTAKKINTTPRGKQLMQMFRADSMDESFPKELDSVIALKKEYESLLKNTSKPKKGQKR